MAATSANSINRILTAVILLIIGSMTAVSAQMYRDVCELRVEIPMKDGVINEKKVRFIVRNDGSIKFSCPDFFLNYELTAIDCSRVNVNTGQPVVKLSNSDDSEVVIMAPLSILITWPYADDPEQLLELPVSKGDMEKYLKFRNSLKYGDQSTTPAPSLAPAARAEQPAVPTPRPVTPEITAPFELDIGAMPTLRFGRYPLSATASDVVDKLAGDGLSPRVGKDKSYTDPEIVFQFDQPGCRVANPEREFWMSPRSVTIPGYDNGKSLQCYVYISENEQPSRVYNGFCITFGFDYGSAYFDDPKQEKAFKDTQKKRAENLFTFIADTLRNKGVPLEGNKKKQKCDGYILDFEQYANRYCVSLRIRRYGDWPIPESIWHLK